MHHSYWKKPRMKSHPLCKMRIYSLRYQWPRLLVSLRNCWVVALSLPTGDWEQRIERDCSYATKMRKLSSRDIPIHAEGLATHHIPASLTKGKADLSVYGVPSTVLWWGTRHTAKPHFNELGWGKRWPIICHRLHRLHNWCHRVMTTLWWSRIWSFPLRSG